jgi:hypothetical protein
MNTATTPSAVAPACNITARQSAKHTLASLALRLQPATFDRLHRSPLVNLAVDLLRGNRCLQWHRAHSDQLRTRLQPLTDHTRHLAREFHAVRACRHGLSQAAGQDSARRHQLLRNRSGLPPA